MCDKRARWGSFGVSGTEPSTQKVSGVAFAAIVAARAADRLADEQTNLGIGRSCVVIFSHSNSIFEGRPNQQNRRTHYFVCAQYCMRAMY